MFYILWKDSKFYKLSLVNDKTSDTTSNKTSDIASNKISDTTSDYAYYNILKIYVCCKVVIRLLMLWLMI